MSSDVLGTVVFNTQEVIFLSNNSYTQNALLDLDFGVGLDEDVIAWPP